MNTEKERMYLSPREKDCLLLAAMGLPNKLIAHQLGVTAETVNTHLDKAFEGLGTNSKLSAVATALESQLIPVSQVIVHYAENFSLSRPPLTSAEYITLRDFLDVPTASTVFMNATRKHATHGIKNRFASIFRKLGITKREAAVAIAYIAKEAGIDLRQPGTPEDIEKVSFLSQKYRALEVNGDKTIVFSPNPTNGEIAIGKEIVKKGGLRLVLKKSHATRRDQIEEKTVAVSLTKEELIDALIRSAQAADAHIDPQEHPYMAFASLLERAKRTDAEETPLGQWKTYQVIIKKFHPQPQKHSS